MRQNRPWPTLALTAPNLCWACALASPVTFLTGDHVMQIGFGQISPSASSTRDLGTRLCMPLIKLSNWGYKFINDWSSFVIELNYVPIFSSLIRQGKGTTALAVETVSETLYENGGNNCIHSIFCYTMIHDFPVSIPSCEAYTYCLINVSFPCVMQLSVASNNENSLRTEVSVRLSCQAGNSQSKSRNTEKES